MKKLATLGIMLVLLSAGAALAITQSQATVAPVLKELKLKPIPSKLIGGPQKYEITDDTIKFLTEAKKAGKVVVLKGDGAIVLEDAK